MPSSWVSYCSAQARLDCWSSARSREAVAGARSATSPDPKPLVVTASAGSSASPASRTAASVTVSASARCTPGAEDTIAADSSGSRDSRGEVSAV